MTSKFHFLLIVFSIAIVGTLIFSLEQSDSTEANFRSKTADLKRDTRIQEPSEQQSHQHHHNEYVCDHDNFMKDKKIVSFELETSPIEATLNHEMELRRQHKDGNWKNIRVLADYSNTKTTSDIKKFIQTQLIPAALGFINQSYRVYPKTSINEVIGQTICHSYNIPSSHFENGINDQDLVLYIGVEDYQSQGSIVRAGPCILDRQTNRPVAAMVQFNKDSFSELNLSDPDQLKWQEWVKMTIHELTHVLGFSSYLFDRFIDPRNNQLLKPSEVYQTDYGRTWITLPSIVSLTKDYFDCSESLGAPLENDGVVGSHWERTTFGNEAMTGSNFPGSVFSIFTFKLLKGSGWYLPYDELAQTYIWGKNEGCDVALAQCSSDSQEFCSSSKDLCSPDNMGVAVCSDSDPLAGGCKYWHEKEDWDCRRHTKGIDNLISKTGGFVGADGRCWVTSLPQQVGLNAYVSCYKSQCTDGNIKFTVGSIDYVCKYDGQVINVKYEKYDGTVTCPQKDIFCAYESNCPANCSGRGTCMDNLCQCWTGFKGLDCSTSK